ncbi:MAG TPA: type IV toxin-antitoxin system AbiEi family antitoxin domain-containing protein [Segeticoccus sp.]|nr:type IV toxin-antitoxin system AbiEi family antitoxin domain-containing protein [Segeticoccus sp.]
MIELIMRPTGNVRDACGRAQPGRAPTRHSDTMHDLLQQRLVATGGVFTTADAGDCGHDRPSLARLVSAGEAVRVRRGAYVAASALADATPERRLALRTLAVLRALDRGGRLVPSHHCCLALRGLPLHGVGDHLHLTRTGPGRTGTSSGVTVHRALAPEVLAPGHAGATANRLHPAVALVQTAATCGVESGVVAADAALAAGHVTADDLAWALPRAGVREGVEQARLMLARADGHAESPGESRARLLFRALDLPAPELQVPIRDAQGFVGRVDFLFRAQRTIVEFDGAVKYEGAQGRAALVREKRREDRLRALGFQVVRLTWPELARPQHVYRVVRAAFAGTAVWATG